MSAADDSNNSQIRRSLSSTNMRSPSNGSMSQLNINVADSDNILNLTNTANNTTTISTIAVQSGDSQIVLAILRSADVVRVRIQQMEPDLLDIGSNLGLTIQYQTIHEELINKLKGKQDQIAELLTRADDVVSQQKSYNEVYEAMARCLGEAWKELNLQLEGRRNLLNQAIRYHTMCERFRERINDARSWFSSLERIDSNEKSLDALLNEHDFYGKDIYEASLVTLDEGQRLLERVKDLGSCSESVNQHSIVAACYEVEHLLGLHQDERRQFEDEWERNRKLLSEYVQMSAVRQEIDQIFDWLQHRGESYLKETDLGRSLDDITYLKRMHTDMENESQIIHDRVIRCMRAVDSWVHTGLSRADRLHAHAHTLLALWEKWALQLGTRRRLLNLAHKFSIDSLNAIDVLNSIENRLISFSSDSFCSSEDLQSTYQQINEQLISSTDIPLREGHILLEKTSPNDSGTQYLRERVFELEKRIETIRTRLRDEYEKLDRQGSSLYQAFDQQCLRTESWLHNVLEQFLHTNRFIIDYNLKNIDINKQAQDFFEAHQQLIERDFKHREEDFRRLKQIFSDLESSNDRHVQIARDRHENLIRIWQNLSEKLTNRTNLAQLIVDFLYQADQLSNGFSSIDDVIRYRDNIDLLPDSAIKHIEETWSNLRYSYDEIIRNGKQIRHQLEKDSENLDLQPNDVNRSTIEKCEILTRTFEQISMNFDCWIRKLSSLRDFKTQWQQYIEDARQTIEKVHRYELNFILNLVPISDHVEKYQKLLNDFSIRVQEMTREVEDRLRTGEQLAFRGETHGQKEQIITELVKVHQQFLSRINQTKSFLHSTINYLKNTSKLETQIHNDRRKFSSLPNDIRTSELLLRQFEGEREKIVEIFNQTRHDFNSLEQKAFQCGATSIFDEIKAKQNEINSKFSAWQRNDEENRSTLNQRVEWCQFVDEKYKIVFELDGLQQEIDKQKRMIPQNVRQATARSEAMHEIYRLFDNCEKAVKRFRSEAQILVERKHPEHEQIELQLQEIDKKLSMIHFSIDDYRQNAEQIVTFYRLIDEVDRWHQDSTETINQIVLQTEHCRTENQTEELLRRVSMAIDQGKQYEQERMKVISALAVQIFGQDEAHHRIKHVTAKNIELINAFIKIHQDISVVQRNFQRQNSLAKELQAVISSAPTFVKSLQDTTTREGARIVLHCQVEGTEPISVIWLKNQTILSSVTNDIQYDRGSATLHLVDVQINDSAYYTCRASNSFGTTETSAYLIVQSPILLVDTDSKHKHRHVPPTFIELLRSQDVRENSTVVFDCIIHAEPTPHVVWERDGVELCQGVSLSHPRSNHYLYRLTLHNVQISDTGSYGCRATTHFGEATSVADLRVFSYTHQQQQQQQQYPHDYLMATGEAPRLTEPLKSSYLIREGQPVKLSCRFEAKPQSEILWSKDGIPIDFEALGISRDFTAVKEVDYTALLIKESFPEDTGLYTVRVSNEFGEVQSNTQLNVEEFFCRTPESEMSDTPCKPVFVQPLRDIVLDEGQKLKLHAAINAHPEPEIIWYCNNIPLKNSRDLTLAFDGQLCTLSKDRCEKENDSGVYRLTAVNSMGLAESVCQVTISSKEMLNFRERVQTVRAPPNIVESLEDKTVTEGDSVTIRSRISGYPKPQIIWYKDNQPIRNTHDHQIRNQDDLYILEIPESFIDDGGTYTIKAINIEGEAKCSCVLRIVTTPTVEHMNIESSTLMAPVGFPPEFLQLFVDRQATLNASIKFEARIIGTLPLNTYWLFNGSSIPDIKINPRYDERNVDDTYSLTIHNISHEDVGRYTLNAENPWGKATCTAQLFVPPTSATGTDSNSNMLSDLLVEMSPSPPTVRKRLFETNSQQQQQQQYLQRGSSMNSRAYEEAYEERRQSSFTSANNNKRYRPLRASLERTQSATREDEYYRRQYPKSIDVFIPFDVIERERNSRAGKSTTMTQNYEFEMEEKRRSSSLSGKQARRTELDEETEYLRCLRELTDQFEKTKRQKKSSDNRKRTAIDTQEEYESVEEVFRQRPVTTTTTTTTTEEVIQRSSFRFPTNKQQATTLTSYSARDETGQRLTAAQRSFSEEVLYKKLIPSAKQIHTTLTSATTSEAGFVTSDDDLTTMEYRIKRKERLKPIRIYSSTSSIPGESTVKYVRTEPQPVELVVPKPQIVTTQGEHSTTIIKDVRRTMGKTTTNIHQQNQRTTIEGEHELKIIKEPISAGQTKAFEFTIPKPVETAPAEHSSTFVVESKKGGRFQTLDVSSALTREHTLTGEHELRVISEPVSAGLHNKAVELLFPKPPLPPAPSHHSSTVVKHTRAPPSSLVIDNIQTTLKGEHELRLVENPIQSGPADSVELIVPKSVTETAEHTTTIITETQPQRRVLEITGSGKKMESEHETKFYRDAVRVEEEVELKLPKTQLERAEHTTTMIKHSRGRAPVIELDSTRLIQGEHETKYVEESIQARSDAMQLLVAKPQAPAEHSTTVVKEQRGKPQVYSIDRTQTIPGQYETKYYEQPVEALGEMHVLFPKHQPVVGPLEGEHMSTIVKQVHSRQVVYDDRLREIPGEHLLTVVDSATNQYDQGRESEVEFIVPKLQTKRGEEHSTTVIKKLRRRPQSVSDYDEVFASSAGEEEMIRRRYRYDEEDGWTSGGEHTTTYVKQARAKFEPIELVVDKPKIMPSVSTLIADIQGPAQVTSIKPAKVLITEDSSVKLDMELNHTQLQGQYDEMELVFEKPLILDSSTKVIANIQPALEVKSIRPANIVQQPTVIEDSSSCLTMHMQQAEEEALELRIRKPQIQDSSSVIIANIQPELGIQGVVKSTPYIPPPVEDSSTVITMDLNADKPVAPFELIIPRIGMESSTSTVVAQINPAIAGIRAKIDVPEVEKSSSKFVLEQKKRLDEEVELIMPKPRQIENSTSIMVADVQAKLETKEIRASQVQPEISTSTFYLDNSVENVVPEPVEIRMKQPMIGESSTTVVANVKATLDTKNIKVLGNPYQPVEESSSAIVLDTVSTQNQPSEVELILPRPHIQDSKSVLIADVRPTLDTSQTHVVIAPPIQSPVKSSSQLIVQEDRVEIAPVELHLHRQPSSHTLVAKLDDARAKHKDMYFLGTINNQNQQYQVRDSSSTLHTDLTQPNSARYMNDNNLNSTLTEEHRREFSSKSSAQERTTTVGSVGGGIDNSSTFITEIEPNHLQPVEFIVSGSLTAPNNTLEQYSSQKYSHVTKQTTGNTDSAADTFGVTTIRMDSKDEAYAPYFIASLRDQTVNEGDSVLFEITVSALPLADITWDRDGEIITVESSFRIDYYSDGRATLYIPETFIDDQGYYTCTARNRLGSCRTTARLSIKSTSTRPSPTRRQLNSTSMSASTIQYQQATPNSLPQSPSYRVQSQSQALSSPSYRSYPGGVVTQVTEETQVFQIPQRVVPVTQNNTISYNVEEDNKTFPTVAFQVSTAKENFVNNSKNNNRGDQDPNPFKIFGAKLKSRPLTGILPTFDTENLQEFSQPLSPGGERNFSQSKGTVFGNQSFQQNSSSSYSSARPDFSRNY